MYHDHHLILYFIFPSFHLHAIKKRFLQFRFMLHTKKQVLLIKRLKNGEAIFTTGHNLYCDYCSALRNVRFKHAII